MTIKNSLITIFLFMSSTLFAQKRKETVYSEKYDTMTVRFFNKNSKPDKEKNYVGDRLVSVKRWYYEKDYYGYRLHDMSSILPMVEYRKEFYNNGQLKAEGTMVNGRESGALKSWFENGEPQCVCNFDKGKRDSIQVIHHENGTVCSEELWTEGKLMQVLYKKDKNGNPLDIGNFKDGNGTILIYDEDAKIISREIFKNGKLIKTEKLDKS